MSDSTAMAAAASAPGRITPRQDRSTRRSHARGPGWLQLLQFAIVGASGYVVNLTVFAGAVHMAGAPAGVAAAMAFSTAVVNNFCWNRSWTFRRCARGRRGRQAVRFLTVSLCAFAASLLVLESLLATDAFPEVVAQAIAVAAVTPANFLGNKLWSFQG